MSSLPPAYKYAPAMLVVAVAAIAYLIVSNIEKKIPTPSSVGRIIDEARRVVDDVKQVVEKAKKLQSAQRPRSVKDEPEKRQLKGKPVSLLDEGLISGVSVSKSRGSTAVFDSVKDADSGKLKLRLSVKGIGAGNNKEGFASGVIDFANPVNARSFQAISIQLKGRGIKGFGISALSKKGPLFFRWDFSYNSGLQERGLYTFQFKSFDLWEYNTINRKYTRIENGPLPEKIDQIQVYLKANHLANQNSGELWIESLLLLRL